MRTTHFIGMDTHCQTTDIAVVTDSGRVTRRERCATAIPALVSVLESVARPRRVVFEEGPLADWLLRNLSGHADQVVACNPRRNHLIAKDSDKDDPIDAEKLARLYRGGYVTPVHHAESLERVVLKRHVELYRDSVHQRVQQGHRITALLRYFGLMVQASAFVDPSSRPELLKHLPDQKLLHDDLTLLWKLYDALVEHETALERTLVRQAKSEPQIVRFTQVPGIHWIRATTFFVHVDTPWRFRSKSALWKYMGIGLQRSHSGSGPEQVRVVPPWTACRPLKDMILGAAKSAIATGKNPFADQHERWIDAGLTPRTARRNVARSQAAVLWGMWKNGNDYQPELVGEALNAVAAKRSADR